MLQRFLYISWLAAGMASDAPGQILRQSRQRNRAEGISGALVFDGERFCQLIEGPVEAVKGLSASIQADARHTRVHVLCDQTLVEGERRLSQWQSGFCDSTELDPFDRASPLVPEQALDDFIAMLTRCDLAS